MTGSCDCKIADAGTQESMAHFLETSSVLERHVKHLFSLHAHVHVCFA